MPKKDLELERLLTAEREACDRYVRLIAPQSSIRDDAMQRAVHELCEDAKRAVERYKQAHPEARG